MPDRAEIEAVRPYLVGAMREARHALGSDSDDTAKARALRMLNDALGRLDRVRDARGDEAALREVRSWCIDGADAIEPRNVLGQIVAVVDRALAARSPQGEDHEAPEFDEQAITDILVAIDDTLWGCGRERMDLIDGPTVDALRDAVKRELVAFVDRSSPSRDGTVAVEQPEPDALGGVPPSQPEEDKR